MPEQNVLGLICSFFVLLFGRSQDRATAGLQRRRDAGPVGLPVPPHARPRRRHQELQNQCVGLFVRCFVLLFFFILHR